VWSDAEHLNKFYFSHITLLQVQRKRKRKRERERERERVEGRGERERETFLRRFENINRFRKYH